MASPTEPPAPEDVATPSRFWQNLGSEHERDREAFGVETVKRHQALRYFTFRFQWSRLPRNDQARFLLRHSCPGEWRRAVSQDMDLSDASWEGVPWPARERRLYTVAIRLAWQYAQRRGHPAIAALEEPALGDPLPVRFDGRLVSQDLASSALETATIDRVLGGRAPARILEVGAGYGRSGHALLTAYPDAQYTIVDIEPTLSMSRWYLGSLFPKDRLRFLLPEEAGSLGDGEFDLALSISSLQEMTNEQITHYLGLLDRVAGGGTVYLKQWARQNNRDDGVAWRFDRMPVPDSWQLELKQRCELQTKFREAGWRVPPRDT